jgi:hypothetical protein
MQNIVGKLLALAAFVVAVAVLLTLITFAALVQAQVWALSRVTTLVCRFVDFTTTSCTTGGATNLPSGGTRGSKNR